MESVCQWNGKYCEKEKGYCDHITKEEPITYQKEGKTFLKVKQVNYE
jgi:hypothetical protein